MRTGIEKFFEFFLEQAFRVKNLKKIFFKDTQSKEKGLPPAQKISARATAPSVKCVLIQLEKQLSDVEFTQLVC